MAFEAYLVSRGTRLSRQRRLVIEALLEAAHHISAIELGARLAKAGFHISKGSLYQTLQLLRDAGIAQYHDFGHGVQELEIVSNALRKGHLHCVQCGRTATFHSADIERHQERVSLLSGFTIVSHRLQIFGHCESCTSKTLV